MTGLFLSVNYLTEEIGKYKYVHTDMKIAIVMFCLSNIFNYKAFKK